MQGVCRIVPEGGVVEVAVVQDGRCWVVSAETVDHGPGARGAVDGVEGEGGEVAGGAGWVVAACDGVAVGAGFGAKFAVEDGA